MKREQFFAISGVIGALFGLGFLLLPDLSLRNYGVPTDPFNLMQARYFGSALLAVGLITFLARETQDAVAVRALLLGNLVGDAAGGIVTLMALGMMNAMAWSSVVIYALFAGASAYYLFATKPQAQAASA
ncbi:hypothetical protein [Ramlibacter sp. PS4R-6]|uniref:hypothetical protein n=1 Tax=Ramlibacter sp. PS4R-6 TaxID=3133438 RepID=UPI0030A75E04